MKPEILYVDDERDNLAVFQATFEDHFSVLCLSSGEEALEVLERTPVPVVVADQRMPGMSGVELFEILRQRHPHTKRIILTGYIDPSAMLDAINKGRAFYFLTKPWQRESLAAVLIRALEAHRVELTNSALTNQLVASQRLAMLGQATAKIAHEMSNQLCMLPLLQHIEQNYADDADLLRLSGFARDMYDRLLHLLNEVKNFVRSDSRELTMLSLSLADTLRECVSFLRFDSQIDCTRLSVEVADEPSVLGSKIKIQQVLANLIKNAAYAIRHKVDGRIRVVLEKSEGAALLVVEDNGCGIPAEVQERIWEPFFTTKGEAGSGLGLDICREIVHCHRGDIWCESQPGQGSKFYIQLPLSSDAAGTPSPTTVAAATVHTPSTAALLQGSMPAVAWTR